MSPSKATGNTSISFKSLFRSPRHFFNMSLRVIFSAECQFRSKWKSANVVPNLRKATLKSPTPDLFHYSPKSQKYLNALFLDSFLLSLSTFCTTFKMAFAAIRHALLNFSMCFMTSVVLLILAVKLIFFILILLKILTPYVTANSCVN